MKKNLRREVVAEPIVEASRAKQAPLRSDEMVYTVQIDHTMSLDDMIAAGNYDWVDDDIKHCFKDQFERQYPLKNGDGLDRTGVQTEDVEIVLVRLYWGGSLFGDDPTTEQAFDVFDERGLKPLTIDLLFALGAARPNLQLELPIVALGSQCEDDTGALCAPYLGKDSRGRLVGLEEYHPYFGWDGFWLAAVRK